MTPEGKVKAAVKRELQARGIWWYCPVQNGMGVTGIPDFVCCWDGKFLAIETKAPGKLRAVTPNQVRVMDEIRLHNGHALVVDNVSQLVEYLDRCPTS